jgi:hypothetical protein
MTQLDVHREPPTDEAINPLASWLVPSGLLICGLLGVALSVATLGGSWSGEITGAVAPELPVHGITLGASGLQDLRGTGAALPAGQKSFAFGYLEFDWDPNAPGGVPGFGSLDELRPQTSNENQIVQSDTGRLQWN